MSADRLYKQAIEALRFCLSRRPPAVKREAEEDWESEEVEVNAFGVGRASRLNKLSINPCLSSK
jgi:hypothetical protein